LDDYLNHIIAEPAKLELENWHRQHGIIYQKLELYYDFIISLFRLIEETYFGSDIINNDIDIDNHFDWCFNKIIYNFQKENINFNSNGIHREYLYAFCISSIYKNYHVNKNKLIYEFFYHLFNPISSKKYLELNILLEIYKIFDLNLKN